jgi:hypothetical protein
MKSPTEMVPGKESLSRPSLPEFRKEEHVVRIGLPGGRRLLMAHLAADAWSVSSVWSRFWERYCYELGVGEL